MLHSLQIILRGEYGNKKEIVDDIKLLLNTLDYDKLKLTVNFIQMLGENTSVASIKSFHVYSYSFSINFKILLNSSRLILVGTKDAFTSSNGRRECFNVS